MNIKPKHLPQISAPFNIMLDSLKDEGILFKKETLMPSEMTPIQPITTLGSIEFETNEKDPIWVAGKTDNENYVIDGHHRWVDSLSLNQPISCIKLFLSVEDACRVLNRIQDLYEYKQKLNLEEIGSHQRNINDRQDSENWLEMVKEKLEMDTDKQKNPNQFIVYREEPLNEKSLVGNFFMLKPLENGDKYGIEFDNLLDTTTMGVEFKTDQNPVDVLAKLWFPNLDFNKMADEEQIPVEHLKNRAIVECAKEMGYDGIKYGNLMIQGF